MGPLKRGDIVRRTSGRDPSARYSVVFCGWRQAYCRPISAEHEGQLNRGEYLRLRELERIEPTP